MAIKIYITGNFLVAEDVATRDQFFKVNVKGVHHKRQLVAGQSDQYSFFQEGLFPQVGDAPQYLQLGFQMAWQWDSPTLEAPSQTVFEFDDIVDGNGIPYADSDTFDNFLNQNLGSCCAGGGGGNAQGIEAFLLSTATTGTGVIWADTGRIGDLHVLFYADNNDEKATFDYYALKRIILTNINPEIKLTTYSTDLPVVAVGDAIRWKLEVRYIAVGEQATKAVDETLFITQILTNLGEDTRQDELKFTLNKALMADQDSILFSLTRVSSDGADNYSGDVAVSEGLFVVETLTHNP
jgi:hypothetical protein